MANCYTCYVPKEWSSLSEEFLKSTIEDKAIKQWKHCKYLEGTTVRLENVTAKLSYYRFRLWMRKADDLNEYPRTSQYFGIKMECILCGKSMKKVEGTVISLEGSVAVLERYQNYTWLRRFDDARTCPHQNDYIAIFVPCIMPGPATTHKNIYVVPREWLAFKNLECTLWRLHSHQIRTFGNSEEFIINANNVTAHLENYSNYLWFRKEHDSAEKPDRKKYSSTFVACIHCNKF